MPSTGVAKLYSQRRPTFKLARCSRAAGSNSGVAEARAAGGAAQRGRRSEHPPRDPRKHQPGGESAAPVCQPWPPEDTAPPQAGATRTRVGLRLPSAGRASSPPSWGGGSSSGAGPARAEGRAPTAARPEKGCAESMQLLAARAARRDPKLGPEVRAPRRGY